MASYGKHFTPGFMTVLRVPGVAAQLQLIDALVDVDAAALDDLDAHGVAWLVFRGDRAVEAATVEETGVQVVQEVGDGRGGAAGVEFGGDRA